MFAASADQSGDSDDTCFQNAPRICPDHSNTLKYGAIDL